MQRLTIKKQLRMNFLNDCSDVSGSRFLYIFSLRMMQLCREEKNLNYFIGAKMASA